MRRSWELAECLFIFMIYFGNTYVSGQCSPPAEYTGVAWFQMYIMNPSGQWIYGLYSASSVTTYRNDNSTVLTVRYDCKSSVMESGFYYYLYNHMALGQFCAKSRLVDGGNALLVSEIGTSGSLTSAADCKALFTPQCFQVTGAAGACSATWKPKTPLRSSPSFTHVECPFQGDYQLTVSYAQEECAGNAASVATAVGSSLTLNACDSQAANRTFKERRILRETLSCLAYTDGSALTQAEIDAGISILLLVSADNQTIYCARYRVDGGTVSMSIDVQVRNYAVCGFSTVKTAKENEFLALQLGPTTTVTSSFLSTVSRESGETGKTSSETGVSMKSETQGGETTEPATEAGGESTAAAESTAAGSVAAGASTAEAASTAAGASTAGAATTAAGASTAVAATTAAGASTAGAASTAAGASTAGAATTAAGASTAGAATTAAGASTAGAATTAAGASTAGAATTAAATDAVSIEETSIAGQTTEGAQSTAAENQSTKPVKSTSIVSESTVSASQSTLPGGLSTPSIGQSTPQSTVVASTTAATAEPSPIERTTKLNPCAATTCPATFNCYVNSDGTARCDCEPGMVASGNATSGNRTCQAAPSNASEAGNIILGIAIACLALAALATLCCLCAERPAWWQNCCRGSTRVIVPRRTIQEQVPQYAEYVDNFAPNRTTTFYDSRPSYAYKIQPPTFPSRTDVYGGGLGVGGGYAGVGSPMIYMSDPGIGNKSYVLARSNIARN